MDKWQLYCGEQVRIKSSEASHHLDRMMELALKSGNPRIAVEIYDTTAQLFRKLGACDTEPRSHAYDMIEKHFNIRNY